MYFLKDKINGIVDEMTVAPGGLIKQEETTVDLREVMQFSRASIISLYADTPMLTYEAPSVYIGFSSTGSFYLMTNCFVVPDEFGTVQFNTDFGVNEVSALTSELLTKLLIKMYLMSGEHFDIYFSNVSAFIRMTAFEALFYQYVMNIDKTKSGCIMAAVTYNIGADKYLLMHCEGSTRTLLMAKSKLPADKVWNVDSSGELTSGSVIKFDIRTAKDGFLCLMERNDDYCIVALDTSVEVVPASSTVRKLLDASVQRAIYDHLEVLLVPTVDFDECINANTGDITLTVLDGVVLTPSVKRKNVKEYSRVNEYMTKYEILESGVDKELERLFDLFKVTTLDRLNDKIQLLL